MAFKLASLFVSIGADQSALTHALAGIKGKLEGLAKMSFSAAGGFAAALGVGATGAAAGITLAIKAAGDMESRMATLSKATDLEGAQLDAMKAQLMQLSTTLKGVALDDLIDIATSGAKMGVASEDLLRYAEGVAKVSSAIDDMPAGEIADRLGKLNTVFKLGVQGTMQLGSAIDKLADSGVSSASGILNVTARISGSAVAAKITAQEATALSAALLDTGTMAEEAASSLLDFMASLNQVEGRKAMARTIGMDAVAFAKMVEDKPIVAIQKFLAALRQMDAASQLSTLGDIGIKGDTHAAEIMKLAQQAESLGKYVGFANHEFESLDQITKSYSTSAALAWSQLASFKNQVQILADSVGGYLMPAFRRLSVGVSEALKSFGGFIAENKPLFESWGAAIEEKVGVGTSALKNWREALEVAREFAKEKVDQIKYSFDWFLENLPPIMDRVALAIADGFEEGMRLAIEVVKANTQTIGSIFNGAFTGAAGSQAAADLVPRKTPRAFTPFNLPDNPGLKVATDRFNDKKGADVAARAAAEAADAVKAAAKLPGDVVAEGMALYHKAVEEEKANSTLAGRRGVDLRKPMSDAERKQALDDLKVDGPGVPPAAKKKKKAGDKDDYGVTDADSYARQLQDGALKGADVQKDILTEAKEQTKTLKEIAANSKNAMKPLRSTWG